MDIPQGGALRAAFFYPEDYSVGMSNLGLHYIYRKLRDNGVDVERFFYSPIPYRSVEGDTLLERFELLFVSVSYEEDVIRLVKWLKGGGIEPRRNVRADTGGPIICIGGAITYINPLLLVGIADIIALGDGEKLIEHAAVVLQSSGDRESKFRRLAEHGNFLVPSLHIDDEASLSCAVHKDRDLSDAYGRSTWVTPRSVFGDSLLVELQRGCVGGCRFCTLPSSFSPVRQRDAANVERDIEEAALAAEFDQIGFITPEAGFYGDIGHVLSVAQRLGKGVSFASLRVDHITSEMLDALAISSRHNITIAPESGSDVLRRACGKHFTNETISQKLAMAKEHGIKAAKLYFMIGLPDETDDDVQKIADLCQMLRSDTGIGITASVSPFVPKIGTAWEDKPFAGIREIKRKVALLKKSFASKKGIALRTGSIKEACLEYILNWSTARTSDDTAADVLRNDADQVDRNRTRDELSRIGFCK